MPYCHSGNTESPWAAPTTTVEVQVNFVKKVIVATQTEEPENKWVSIFTACHWSNETHSHSNAKAYKVVKTNRTLLFFFLRCCTTYYSFCLPAVRFCDCESINNWVFVHVIVNQDKAFFFFNFRCISLSVTFMYVYFYLQLIQHFLT